MVGSVRSPMQCRLHARRLTHDAVHAQGVCPVLALQRLAKLMSGAERASMRRDPSPLRKLLRSVARAPPPASATAACARVLCITQLGVDTNDEHVAAVLNASAALLREPGALTGLLGMEPLSRLVEAYATCGLHVDLLEALVEAALRGVPTASMAPVLRVLHCLAWNEGTPQVSPPTLVPV